MSDISVRTSQTLVQDDQRWIGNGGEPIGKPRSILLDRSAFDFVTNFPNGHLPSGIVLGKITATGLYAPYGASPSEVQTVTVDATGGTFTISFDGETTAAIAANETAANVQAALLLLSNLNTGDLTVARSGSVNAYVYTLTFGGQYLGVNVPAVTTGAGSLTGGAGTAAVATSTAGGGSASDGTEVAQGHLFAAVTVDPDSTGDIAAALFWSGEVDESALPTHHGLDAAAKVDLKHIAYV